MFDWARFRNRDFENSLTAYRSNISASAELRPRYSIATRQITHVFCSMLVDCQVDSAERPSSNLLLDHILIDAENGTPVVLAIGVLGARVECFFDLARCRGFATVVPQWTHIRGRRTTSTRISECHRSHGGPCYRCVTTEGLSGASPDPGTSMETSCGVVKASRLPDSDGIGGGRSSVGVRLSAK